jgi:hypothetical protein
MQHLFAVDWQHFFVPSIALAEIILRGSLIYLGIFALMHFVLKSEAGTIGLSDLLMKPCAGGCDRSGLRQFSTAKLYYFLSSFP